MMYGFEGFDYFLAIFELSIVDLVEIFLRVGYLYTYASIHMYTFT